MLRKTLITAVAFFILSFTTNEEKKYKVELTVAQWQKHLSGFDIIAQQLRQSDLPSKNVSYILDSVIAPFQIEIITQIQQQLPKDTTKKK